MWIILLSIYVFAEVSMGEMDCDKDFFQSCKQPKMFYEIPLDVKVFYSLCPEFSTYVECMRDYDMKCEKEEYRMFDQPEKYADFLAVLEEICEEGSALNEVVTSKLKCLNETFSNTNCLQEMDAFAKPYIEPVEPLDGFAPSHIPERILCLSDILLAHCVVKDIKGNCGIRAGYATLEYIHRSSFVDGSCASSERKSLLEDIDEFNLTEEEKNFAIVEFERLALLDDI